MINPFSDLPFVCQEWYYEFTPFDKVLCRVVMLAFDKNCGYHGADDIVAALVQLK